MTEIDVWRTPSSHQSSKPQILIAGSCHLKELILRMDSPRSLRVVEGSGCVGVVADRLPPSLCRPPFRDSDPERSWVQDIIQEGGRPPTSGTWTSGR